MAKSAKQSSPQKTKRPVWLRIIRWTVGIAVAIAALIAMILCFVVWIFTPQKLTPLVEKYASGYLDADVTASRVELTVWSTFPHIRLDIDSLTIVSRTLRGLPAAERDSLPAFADTLLQVESLTGGINLAKIALGTIDLHHVEIVRPAINLVQATPTAANYTIVPASDEESSSSGTIPDIEINRFAIVGDAPIRYVSLPDSTDIRLTLASSGIDGSGEIRPYHVSVSGITSLTSAGTPLLSDFTIGIDGNIRWSASSPESIALTDFDISLDSIGTRLDADLSMSDPMTVNSASISIAPVAVSKLISYLPDEAKKGFDGLDTDLTIGMDLALTAPYTPATDLLPSARIDMRIPDGSLCYQGFRLRKAGAELSADINGHYPDSSSVDIKRLELTGSGIAMKLDGQLTEPLSDPSVKGNFDGNVTLDALPRILTRNIPVKLSGSLSGTTGFRFRKSDLSRNGFHRAYLSGRLDLHKLHITDADSLDIFVGHASFKLGTSTSLTTVAAGRVDSLLTASLMIDTANVALPDMQIAIARSDIGIASRNIATSADTSAINPIGGKISIGRMDYRSLTDSTRLRMRDIKCGAVLQRFKGQGRVPQLGMKASARRIAYGNGLTRMSVRDGEFDITAHLNPPRKLPAHIQARYDSIAAANPGASHDSIVSIMMPARHRQHMQSENELLDLAVDQSIAKLLTRWDIRGHLMAKSGRMVTPYFPLRNRISDLDMTFTTDSISLNSFILNAGGSDMALSGDISNIRRAVTSRRGSPLKIRFNVESDTLNINEITRAIFTGAAFDQHADSLRELIAADANDDEIQHTIENTTPDSTGALLIPTNIDAELILNAHNILYSDIMFNRLGGSILVYNGGINLNDLTARTDIGTLNLTALYSARTRRDISFGFSLGVRDFNIERFTQLMPVVDSLLPLMRDFKGIINADVAATTSVDSMMNIELPTLHAAIKLTGDSLVVLDKETFRTMSKWLLFKNKKHNMIDHMEVELTVNNSQLEFYPFIFDMDRYRLGVMGHNDLALNLNYHISVLKSPLPFKFGINITGNADKMRIRLGKARFKENMVSERTTIVEDTRINLLKEIESVFKRGVKAARLGPLSIKRPANLSETDVTSDTISHADSLIFANEGLIKMPADTVPPQPLPDKKKKKKK